MGNPFYNQFGGGNQQPQNNLFTQFMQFRNNFSGDPKQEVQNLLNSGRMSQQQFNYLSQLAQQFQQMFRR